LSLVVEHKDVVLALLGASAALAGLLLVFLGLVTAAYGGLAGDDPPSVRGPLRRTALVLMADLGAGLAAVVCSTVWLTELTGGRVLYGATIVLFLVQITGLMVGTVWTLRELMWG
jgi:uncharacterized membrane protein